MRFGPFVLDPVNRQLMRGDEVVELGSRYFDALELLVRHPHTLIAKDRFMDEVWRGIPVTDEALTQCIRTLRRALGDKASAPDFIETVPKHGYRFLADVEAAGAQPFARKSAPTSPAARIAGATTLGGLGAGFVGGAFYGVLGTSGGVSAFVTVLLLTTALAVLGGAGIGTGMALASLWRGEQSLALIAGGGAGGVVVGSLGSALALHGMQALTGVMPPQVTGLFEGLALGLAAGFALVSARKLALSRRAALLCAAGTGALIAGITAFFGGRFYAMTLLLMEREFPRSRLDMGGVARLFGEDGFYMFTQLGTAMLEGAVFASAIVFANFAWRR